MSSKLGCGALASFKVIVICYKWFDFAQVFISHLREYGNNFSLVSDREGSADFSKAFAEPTNHLFLKVIVVRFPAPQFTRSAATYMSLKSKYEIEIELSEPVSEKYVQELMTPEDAFEEDLA